MPVGTRDDIDRLATEVNAIVEVTPFADYLFRLMCPKAVWARYLADTASDIDYDNFKNAMSKLFGVERMNQLHEVWAVMQGTPLDNHDFK